MWKNFRRVARAVVGRKNEFASTQYSMFLLEIGKVRLEGVTSLHEIHAALAHGSDTFPLSKMSSPTKEKVD